MAKVFPPMASQRVWPNLIAAIAFKFSPNLKKYVSDLEEFREAHRFD